jgi:hypothetical protein
MVVSVYGATVLVAVMVVVGVGGYGCLLVIWYGSVEALCSDEGDKIMCAQLYMFSFKY